MAVLAMTPEIRELRERVRDLMDRPVYPNEPRSTARTTRPRRWSRSSGPRSGGRPVGPTSGPRRAAAAAGSSPTPSSTS